MWILPAIDTYSRKIHFFFKIAQSTAKKHLARKKNFGSFIFIMIVVRLFLILNGPVRRLFRKSIWGKIGMPRRRHADEAGGLFLALNWGNLHGENCPNDADYGAFKRILHERHQRPHVHFSSYQLTPNRNSQCPQ